MGRCPGSTSRLKAVRQHLPFIDRSGRRPQHGEDAQPRFIDMSKITAIRTVRITDRPNLFWLEIEDEDGHTGLGETFRGAATVATAVEEQVAPWLLGRDSRQIEAISRYLTRPTVGFGSSGAEIRAASAVDIALWDLAGQRHGVPVHEMLGGAARDRVKTYNTCAGYAYNSGGRGVRTITSSDEMQGPYDDQVAFNRDAGALAESLLEQGIRGMKIWPFDVYAVAGGHRIDLDDLKAGLEPFRKIRAAVGDKMEVMCELHNLWSVTAAARICQALEDYDVFWAEDALNKMDNVPGLQDLRARTRVPICGSETLGGVGVFRDLLAAQALDIVMVDLGWCGGITEGRKIAALAEAYAKPFTAHDCTGPVGLVAGLHMCIHAPTGIYQEMVRAATTTWYQELSTFVPAPRDGYLLAPTAPGLGIALNPAVWQRADLIVQEFGKPRVRRGH